jgi:RIP metalloprotease RseP
MGILVTVHEFGHFFIARLCGVHVECFSIGFGKKIWSHKFSSGTEFVIAMIPLGGYVRMLNEDVKKTSNHDEKFAFNRKKIWQKMAIIFAGPFANFVLAAIIYWIIFLNGVMVYPIKVKDTIANTPVSILHIPYGVELKTIDNIDINSWDDVKLALISVLGQNSVSLSYIDKDNNGNPIEVTKSVDISHWNFDIEKESPITAFGLLPKTLEVYPIVSKIVPKSAAQKAGLQVGDEIISYNNHLYTNWNDFSTEVKKANAMVLKVKRGKSEIYLDLIPTVQKNGEGVAGLYPSSEAVVKQYGFLEGLGKGIEQTVLTAKLTVGSLYQLITGVIGLKHLSGPITIAKSAGQTASYGFTPYLYFLAFISISLGVINLVPLPILDGGQLVFLLLEKIKGKALSEQTQERLFRIGFFLLILIMGIALFNDFLRL